MKTQYFSETDTLYTELHANPVEERATLIRMRS